MRDLLEVNEASTSSRNSVLNGWLASPFDHRVIIRWGEKVACRTGVRRALGADMKRFIILIALLTVASMALAQAVVTSSGQATLQGPGVMPAPASGPLLVTPLVHLGVAPPAVGATNATLGNTAGASNATAQQVQPPAPVTMLPEINLGQGAVYQVPVPVGTTAMGPASTVVVVAPGTASAGAAGASAPAPYFERGVTTAMPWQAGTGIGDRSLGELARENRQQGQAMQTRTFTNQDVEKLSNQGVGTVGGTAGAAVSSGNATYPANNGVITNPSAVAQPAQPGVAQPSNPPAQVQPSNPQPRASQTAPSTPPSSEMAQATQPPSPAGAANQNPDQNAPAGRELPRSGSILPLVTVVGLLATGAGLLSR